MLEARELLRRSISRPAEERKRILRELQVKWHPDKQYGDESSQQFADELSRMANEAAAVARKQAKAVAEKKRRMEAYETLRGLVNRASVQSRDELASAIQEARDAGVSDVEIEKAEAKLKSLAAGASR